MAVSIHVAVTTGCHDVRPIPAPVLAGNQVFSSCLQACCLAQGQAVCQRVPPLIDEPHGQAAVVAQATLTMKGSITGESVALSHGRVQVGEGGIPVASTEDAQVPAAVRLCRHNTGGLSLTGAVFIVRVSTRCQDTLGHALRSGWQWIPTASRVRA